tara:strand:- start:7108 stop:7548 length:441 start_codon:yes stop_codon:yes gene_type:complete
MRNKTDKIFDNNFESPEMEAKSISFDLDASVRGSFTEEENIYYEMLSAEIHDTIELSRFKKFNEVNEFAEVIKLKKLDINEVYSYILDELLKKYSRIDIFSELCNYFNIEPVKFYNSLSNIFKEELIIELDKKTKVLSKKNINKLF